MSYVIFFGLRDSLWYFTSGKDFMVIRPVGPEIFARCQKAVKKGRYHQPLRHCVLVFGHKEFIYTLSVLMLDTLMMFIPKIAFDVFEKLSKTVQVGYFFDYQDF